MRSVATFAVAASVLLFAGMRATAEDHHVGECALAELGLGGMKPVSSQRGMQVRGQGSLSLAMGLSAVSGILLDPHTGSFIVGGDANSAMALAERVGPNSATEASAQQQSTTQIQLEVLTSPFSGLIISAAGGTSFARGR